MHERYCQLTVLSFFGKVIYAKNWACTSDTAKSGTASDDTFNLLVF